MSLMRAFRKRLFHLEVWFGLAWARFLIKYIPFKLWRSTLGPIDGEQDGQGDGPPLSAARLKQAADTGRIIARVARRAWFEAVCLPQAMTGRWVLARRSIPSRIVIGSRRGEPEEGLLFHAWLMVGDSVVTGAEEREAFLAFRKRPAAFDAG